MVRRFNWVVWVVWWTFGASGIAEHSALWGESGEGWTPESRLPDFSFAGYHHGEDPLPDEPATANVRDFGAVGDGRTDDTVAFRRVIEETDSGAILIPTGRYRITDILWVRKPNLVLRGEGPDRTILVFPKGLEAVRPNMGHTTSGRPTSNYSWSGGFLWARGSYGDKVLGPIKPGPRRGDREITADRSHGLATGQRVVIELQDDRERTLLATLYSDDPGDTRKITKPVRPRMVNRIAAVDGHRIRLARPLRFDLREEWTPTLRAFEPTVTEVGFEHLACEFPNTPYQGHFTEVGFNAIAFNDTADCWVRNVRITNSDSAMYLSGVFCTADGVVVTSDRKPARGATGHHGISYGSDCLTTNFDLQTHFIHDITVSYLAAGNVTKNGRGTNLSLDHHKKAPYENLFCNLDAGLGTELWRCGGGASLGKHCGARGTFWAIHADRDQSWPPANFGPDSMNLVGVRTAAESILNPDGRWLETIPPDQLEPADLHAAQLHRRLTAQP